MTTHIKTAYDFKIDDVFIHGKGKVNLRPTNHFKERWVERVGLDSSYFRVELLEKRYMFMGTIGAKSPTPAYHLLIKIKNTFFVLVVASDGNMKTVLNEKVYRRQMHAVNLSKKMDSYHNKFKPTSFLNLRIKEFESRIEKHETKIQNVAKHLPKEAIVASAVYQVQDKKLRAAIRRCELLQGSTAKAVQKGVKEHPVHLELVKKYDDLFATCVKLRRELTEIKEK